MPLIKGKSQKDFTHNLKAEMHAGKPKDQSLAIAYSVKRKAKKKASGGAVESGSKDMNMAEGGEVSASNEKRPMPSDTYNDSAMKSRNSGNKSAKNDSWTDNITLQQAQKPSPTKPSRPSLKGSDAFSVRYRDEIEEDLHRLDSMPPESDKTQPPSRDDEEGPNRQGPNVSDMEEEHSTHKKPYADGGQIEASDERIHADGKYEDDVTDLIPSEDKGHKYTNALDEIDQNRQGSNVSDMEEEHTTGKKPYAEGGSIQFKDNEDNLNMEQDNDIRGHSLDDSEEQQKEETKKERFNSIASAIMAKKRMDTEDGMSGSTDEDDAEMYARGGEILEDSPSIHSHGSMDSDDSSQVDLTRNADEDANEEDQSSFNALRKENYNTSYWDAHQPDDSNTKSDSEAEDSMNKHDMISSIRLKMNKKRQFPSR